MLFGGWGDDEYDFIHKDFEVFLQQSVEDLQ